MRAVGVTGAPANREANVHPLANERGQVLESHIAHNGKRAGARENRLGGVLFCGTLVAHFLGRRWASSGRNEN